MIVKFSSNSFKKVGNKAKSLIEMKQAGFNVPDGFALDSDTYIEEVKNNKLNKKISSLLDKLNKTNISEVSKKIIKLFNILNNLIIYKSNVVNYEVIWKRIFNYIKRNHNLNYNYIIFQFKQ